MLQPQRAVPADALLIARCISAAYAPYIERIGKPPGPMLDDYEQMIAQHEVWVLRDSAEIVGALVLIQHDDYLLLDNVGINPHHQGRGLGKQLCLLAEARARAHGYSEIRLYTHERMVENVAIYTKLGYAEFERRRERGYARIYMRKSV